MSTAGAAKAYGNFIDGEWVRARSGKAFENRNPARTDEVIGLFADGDSEDVAAAVEAAADAFRSWRLVPAPKRAEILFRAAEMLVARKEGFARDMTREMGKILLETRGDVQEAIDMTYYMAGEGRRQFGVTTPSELPDKFAMTVRAPVGVSAMITPWNFPMAIPAWKIMPSLVLGNTVVIKPASDTPLSVCHLAETLSEAGVPRGVVNVVTGSGRAVGEPLLRHQDVRLVSFTGSTEIGRKVSEACAPEFKHCQLEMGGKNAIVVLADANLEIAVDGAIWGGFGTAGQRCTAASRVIVEKTIYPTFLEQFVARAKSLRVGDGLDPATEMGPCISQAQLDTVMSYVEIGKQEGARLACGGHRLDTGPFAQGWYHEPTIFADADPRMRVAREEIFGPVVSVIPADSFEQAVEIARGVEYGLSSSVYTRDVNRAFRAIREFDTGIVYVNAPTIGAETHLPFGGTKSTGNGHREAAVAALDFYSEWKTVYVDFSDRLQRAQIDTGSFGSVGR